MSRDEYDELREMAKEIKEIHHTIVGDPGKEDDPGLGGRISKNESKIEVLESKWKTFGNVVTGIVVSVVSAGLIALIALL